MSAALEARASAHPRPPLPAWFSRGVHMISFSADALVFLRACRESAALEAPAR